jgi:hypothetical protein
MRYIILLFFSTVFFADVKIEFLDIKVLKSSSVNGLKFTEISDLAYDKKDNLFFAISDRGRVFKLKIDIDDDKIGKVKYINAEVLKGKNGKKFTRRYKDSESLAFVKNKLLISFEGKSRIIKYDNNLKYIKKLKLPKDLKYMLKHHHSRDGFEALTYSKKYGFITAREKPFWMSQKGYHKIFGKYGEICQIKRDKNNFAITEFEMLEDGNLLGLFRDFSLKKLRFKVALKKIYLNDIKDGICRVDDIIMLDAFKDKYVDNFEGLTHVRDDLYLMISDDNNNIFQKTILRLFRLKENK